MLKCISLALFMSSALWTQETYAMNEELSQTDGEKFYKTAKSLLSKGDQNTSEAIRHLEDAIKEGNLKAKFKLAVIYESGFGVTKDYPKALDLYKKLMKSNKEARKKYINLNKKLIKKGNIEAMLNLAEMYKGEGNIQKESILLERAIEKKNVSALIRLGEIYQEKSKKDRITHKHKYRACNEFRGENYPKEGHYNHLELSLKRPPITLRADHYYNIKELLLYKKALNWENIDEKEKISQLLEQLNNNIDKQLSDNHYGREYSFLTQELVLAQKLSQGKNIKEIEKYKNWEPFEFSKEPEYTITKGFESLAQDIFERRSDAKSTYIYLKGLWKEKEVAFYSSNHLSYYYIRAWMAENGCDEEKKNPFNALEYYVNVLDFFAETTPLKDEAAIICKRVYNLLKKVDYINPSVLATYLWWNEDKKSKLFEKITQKQKISTLMYLGTMYMLKYGGRKNFQKIIDLFQEMTVLEAPMAKVIWEKLSTLKEEPKKVIPFVDELIKRESTTEDF
jgi:TPR repeat protein